VSSQVRWVGEGAGVVGSGKTVVGATIESEGVSMLAPKCGTVSIQCCMLVRSAW
jgi:hypothetical protein